MAANEEADLREAGHYVVTAQEPGAIVQAAKCSFLAPGSVDVVIAKSRHLEVRRLANSESNETASLPIILSAPLNGRITNILPFTHPSSDTDYIFFTTETKRYAVISYAGQEQTSSSSVPGNQDSRNIRNSTSTTPYNIITHATGNLADYGLAIRGNEPESGPLAAIEPNHKCIALHFYEGFVTFLPIHSSYRYRGQSNTSNRAHSKKSVWEFLGPPNHCRIEERDVFCMTFLLSRKEKDENVSSLVGSSRQQYMPQLVLLHQDSRGNQHVVAHSVDLVEKSLILHNAVAPIGSHGSKVVIPPLVEHRLKKSRVDGSSGLVIAVPPVGWSNGDSGIEGSGGMKMDADDNMNEDSKVWPSDSNGACCFGGVLILGEKQITYHDTSKNVTKILPISQFITLSYAHVYPIGSTSDQDVVRYLLGDEDGKIHILAVARTKNDDVTGLHLDTLGVTNISSSLLYLERGLVFVGSQTADSQFIQILDQPVEINEDPRQNTYLSDGRNTTYINVLDEYTNLGPIVDFAMMPTAHHSYGATSDRQFMAVTASGAEKDGSIRLVRDGIGMVEHASIDLGGIKGMWSIRKSFHDKDDTFLIQSYVGETRVLGVVIDDEEIDETIEMSESDDAAVSASLAETNIEGFDSTRSTLFSGNISVDGNSDMSIMVQITEKEIRLISIVASRCLMTWIPETAGLITVASANESGQIGVALRGGELVYLQVQHSPGDLNDIKIETVGSSDLGQEISCIDLNPFDSDGNNTTMNVVIAMDVETETSMDIDTDIVRKSAMIIVGLWDSSSVQILSLDRSNPLAKLCTVNLEDEQFKDGEETSGARQMMVRSLCLITLTNSSTSNDAPNSSNKSASFDMMFVGLGEGTLISFVLNKSCGEGNVLSWSAKSRKEVSIGTRALSLVPFDNRSTDGGKCVLASGDRPTVISLSRAGNSSSNSPRLCYPNIHLSAEDEEALLDLPPAGNNAPLVVNAATQFHSSALFDMSDQRNNGYYSLCISDDSMLRLGVIDDLQKLHVTTHKLGMPPKKVTYDENSRLLCVGCIDNGMNGGRSSHRIASNMGNCIRFFDDSTFEEIDRFDLNPYETILSMITARLKVENDQPMTESGDSKAPGSTNNDVYCPFLIIGTAFDYPDEDEPSRGRIIVLNCSSDHKNDSFSRKVKKVAEVQVKGGVFSVCPFYDGSILATINSKTRVCKLIGGYDDDVLDLKIFGAGHHGHIMSLHVRSLAEDYGPRDSKGREQLAIIGDMIRSISVVKYYPEHKTLEEVSRDFNQNWVTAIEMLTDNTYLGAENFNNIFALRYNPTASSEEIRCRLDTIGVFNLGEMINKFMRGSLATSTMSNVVDSHAPGSASNQRNAGDRSAKLAPGIGSQTLFGTVDGTLGSIIGLDARSKTFFSALQRAMVRNVEPIGNLSHSDFRSQRAQREQQPSRGFVDGDLIESFLNLDSATMHIVVEEMNKEKKWDVDRMETHGGDEIDKVLTVDEVLTMVEDMSMTH